METLTPISTKEKITSALAEIDDEIFLQSIYNIINKVNAEKEKSY